MRGRQKEFANKNRNLYQQGHNPCANESVRYVFRFWPSFGPDPLGFSLSCLKSWRVVSKNEIARFVKLESCHRFFCTRIMSLLMQVSIDIGKFLLTAVHYCLSHPNEVCGLTSILENCQMNKTRDPPSRFSQKPSFCCSRVPKTFLRWLETQNEMRG